MTIHSPAIAIEDVVFRWKPDQPCLDIPGINIMAGERLFLHGPSGCGKSTLLALLAGVLVPQQGDITVLGQPLASLSASERDRFRVDHIGFVFQQFNVLPYLSVLENTVLPCRFSRRRAAQAIVTSGSVGAEAHRLLSRLGLGQALLARPAAMLSVGQQQRVAAARALMGTPALLIADEPTSSLDAARQLDFLALLQECAAASSTLVVVSHDQRLATHFSHTLALPEINRAAPGHHDDGPLRCAIW
ncbi:ATP-binding cassette domain-containing protein [Actimicrobium sp. CCC2.4]|uniref:ATP-binding cassette domain-containing protein n=1 Tax=Actimicrobium sp. CCC2.4 TaxID=3048606 RepID=UPI002AC8B9D8|nr:ATP-binding cassette domain-containing protein [Actimicrobium sp. CCC2.4]MEB0134662.1 ATP-binding cassette domain-containing protein [Actimicrobium sp. CCC2.4]WPX30605.1 ATP-binding cassette domain-containing protein [Actimicrobium sp. CCC2.4]